MRIGLYLVPLTAQIEALQAIGARSDGDPGIHSVWLPEPHLLAFPDYSDFPYAEDGNMPDEYTADGELDGFLTLAFLAAKTARVRIGIGVCIVPQREPIGVAKAVTTLDHLSGGRFDFGVGIGWMEEEFRAVGLPFEDRVQRCRDGLELMTALWTDKTDGLGGGSSPVAGATQMPFPLQKPHPPVYFGGNGRRALERVTELGSGWLPWDLTPEQARAGISQMEEMLEERERQRTDVLVNVATTQPIEEIDRDAFASAGVDELLVVVPTPRSGQEVDALFERLTRLTASAETTSDSGVSDA